MSWNAERRRPIIESTEPYASRRGQPQGPPFPLRDITPGPRCTRGHVVECTTVLPATSAYMRKPTTSSGVHDSGVG
eukprot:633129-Prorocentrum_minimum.AAC.1